jgi:hypothetical protein
VDGGAQGMSDRPAKEGIKTSAGADHGPSPRSSRATTCTISVSSCWKVSR